jgi:hypothetical protein
MALLRWSLHSALAPALEYSLAPRPAAPEPESGAAGAHTLKVITYYLKNYLFCRVNQTRSKSSTTQLKTPDFFTAKLSPCQLEICSMSQMTWHSAIRVGHFNC